jgi:hypothetical protein
MPRPMTLEKPRFQIDPTAKLKILQMEPAGCTLKVTAQFNPKEIQIDKAVPWTKQQAKKKTADLEFTGDEPKTMSIELLFDGYESGVSVVEHLEILEGMTQHFGTKSNEKRPPMVRVIWGADSEKSKCLPRFNGVIEGVVVKYTMFARSGEVLRATATVKLKQAEFPGIAKPK